MLSYFDKTADKSFYTSALTLDVYGPTDQFLLLDDEADACAMLPVLGIKHGTRAMLGAITQGDADASIHISPGLVSSAVPLNRIYFELHYRYSYRIYLPNLNVNGKDLASTLYGLKAEDNFRLIVK